MAASLRIDPTRAGGSAATRAGELAARQFGAVARWQLIGAGLTAAQVDHLTNSARLHSRYPGVYAFGRRDLSTEGELAAALLYAGPGAALGGISALWWMNLLERRPELIHVDAVGRRSSRANILIRHPRHVRRVWVRGLPCVPLPAALLASAADLRHDSLRLALARAEFHHLLHLPDLSSALGEGRTGTRAVRAAMAAHLPQLARCESPLEIDFVLLCERFGVPLPEPNPRIGRWRPDMLWREARLIAELDGRDAHHSPAQLAADERREADLRLRGFNVVRYRWRQVHREATAVAADLLARLG